MGVGRDGQLSGSRHPAVGVGVRVEQTDLGQQRLGGQIEGLGDGLHHPEGRLVQAPLDLGEVGVRDRGQLGHLPQGEVGELALGAHEIAERLQLLLPRLFRHRMIMPGNR